MDGSLHSSMRLLSFQLWWRDWDRPRGLKTWVWKSRSVPGSQVWAGVSQWTGESLIFQEVQTGIHKAE